MNREGMQKTWVLLSGPAEDTVVSSCADPRAAFSQKIEAGLERRNEALAPGGQEQTAAAHERYAELAGNFPHKTVVTQKVGGLRFRGQKDHRGIGNTEIVGSEFRQ